MRRAEFIAQFERLTRPQRDALAYVERHALRRKAGAEAKLFASLRANAVSQITYQGAMERLLSEARVVLAFHPERVSRSGQSVAEGLLSDGIYKNQFETGLSSGSTSAFAGGRRDQWERRLFGEAYHQSGVDTAERPKYGALLLVGHPDGPCPRFGSCYFVLRPEVSSRCSFTLMGSHEDAASEQTGTLNVLEPVMAALTHHIESFPAPLGFEGLTFQRFVTEVQARLPILPDGSANQLGRALDSFVEVQVHGSVDLQRDVEALVVDASFLGTPVARTLTKLSSTYDISLRWHPGFTLAPAEFPDVFRDFPVRQIAERVARDGIVNAPNLGAGSNDFVLSPRSWEGLGSLSEIRTSFRRVWHVLVLSGGPSHHWQEVSDD
jgi:hypothetical protein